MLEGRPLPNSKNSDAMHIESADFEVKFQMSKCPKRIQQ